MAWYNFWRKPEPVFENDSDVVKSLWRNNMWVMTPYGIGILFKIGNPNTVHLVDPKTGETLKEISVVHNSLRQAKLAEIPASRKVGLTPERATRLGYF